MHTRPFDQSISTGDLDKCFAASPHVIRGGTQRLPSQVPMYMEPQTAIAVCYNSHNHTHVQKHTRTHTYTLKLPCTWGHRLLSRCVVTLTITHTHTHTHSHTHTHTLKCTLHKHMHKHMHLHTPSPKLLRTWSHRQLTWSSNFKGTCIVIDVNVCAVPKQWLRMIEILSLVSECLDT
jgi:hypothetical protein